MKSRYFLKNKRRFYSIIVVLASSILLSSALAVSAHDTGTSSSYHTVTVEKGDTLWSIAKEYNHNGDIRKLIYEIQNENQLDSCLIYEGEELRVPIHF